MNKDSSIVKKIHPILRYETEACAEYLEKMAAKGLFIKSIVSVQNVLSKDDICIPI